MDQIFTILGHWAPHKESFDQKLSFYFIDFFYGFYFMFNWGITQDSENNKNCNSSLCVNVCGLGHFEGISYLGSSADLISQTDGPVTGREEYSLVFQYETLPLLYFFPYKSLSVSIHLGRVTRNPKGRVTLPKAQLYHRNNEMRE